MIDGAQAIAEARAGRFVEAWEAACAAPTPREAAEMRVYVRYHAGDLEGALAEARAGLAQLSDDGYLLGTATEIALTLHRGAAAEELLGAWKARAAAEDAPRIAAATSELATLRGSEGRAASGIARGRWISALLGALALAFLLRWARGARSPGT